MLTSGIDAEIDVRLPQNSLEADTANNLINNALTDKLETGHIDFPDFEHKVS